MSIRELALKYTTVKPKAEKLVVVAKPSLPVVERSYYIPASDKIFAIDKSGDLNVVNRTEITKLHELRLSAILLMRKFHKRCPTFLYRRFHSANVFGYKSCYIFYDYKRNIEVALTTQEIKDKLKV